MGWEPPECKKYNELLEASKDAIQDMLKKAKALPSGTSRTRILQRVINFKRQLWRRAVVSVRSAAAAGTPAKGGRRRRRSKTRRRRRRRRKSRLMKSRRRRNRR